MNTTTKPASARPTLKFRTTVRAGSSTTLVDGNEGRDNSFGIVRPRRFGDVVVNGEI